MDKWSHAQLSVGYSYSSIPKLNGGVVEICELISDFISHFIMDVIMYPYWGYN